LKGLALKEQLRIQLMTAKLLQLCADLFALLGVFLFAYLYFSIWKSSLSSALHDPFFVVTVLLPFIPSAVLSYLASQKRKQVRALLEESQKSS
jgi:hypothetical protein